MNVVAGRGVAELVAERGGRLFVWCDHQRCCQGVTYLMTSTDPKERRSFEEVPGTEGFELWFDPGPLQAPSELTLEVRGWRTKRVDAYWNGCVFVT